MSQVNRNSSQDIERPVLDLSADILRRSLQAMVAGSNDHGGIERYIDAVKLKSKMFQQALVNIESGELDIEAFKGLCTFMATVRRRIGPWLNEDSFKQVREGLQELFISTDSVDARIAQFCSLFPDDKVIAGCATLQRKCCTTAIRNAYPLMNRWIWDAKANTGVIREIWHADDVDHITIHVGDGYGTYLDVARGAQPVSER